MMDGVKKIVVAIKNERRRLMIFFVVGITANALVIGMYALFSRILWSHGPKTLEYAICVILGTLANFEANRYFTFSAARSYSSALRFGLVAVVAIGLSSTLFWLGHDVLHINDILVAVANVFIIAVFTFSAHRLFTFHPDPWRHFGKSRLNSSTEQTSEL